MSKIVIDLRKQISDAIRANNSRFKKPKIHAASKLRKKIANELSKRIFANPQEFLSIHTDRYSMSVDTTPILDEIDKIYKKNLELFEMANYRTQTSVYFPSLYYTTPRIEDPEFRKTVDELAQELKTSIEDNGNKLAESLIKNRLGKKKNGNK